MSNAKHDATAELDRDAIAKDFADAVNMTPSELESWLKSEDSKAVGFTPGGGKESVGHDSGRKIVAIKHKKKAELSTADLEHMRKVVGYVHRHLAQGGPADDIEHSRWRYSLMNWGHDPLKK
ncbi:DUF3140 domain-containing protein [Novosphingobium sp. 9U]|uniref:DUF3140 domain-containing protein n=1 Tax=Novosphingobium sp. 9U TaxID=2653158 RepID=UPI0012F35377|nr:DUF3140 domain-containing protein [Novosphingobium sp. 9U]VWX55075.1 conserved hypothetical protein [Novosphingobium sp. 9U]